MNRSRLAILLPPLLGFLCLLGGCSSSGSTAVSSEAASSASPASPVSGLVPRTSPPIADLPVPIGFEIVDAISRHYQAGAIRFIDHTYKGSADRFAAEAFYKEQMPRNGWAAVQSRLVRGRMVLEFRKGAELATVEIASQDKWAVGRVTEITLSLAPGAGSGPSTGQ